MWQIVRWVCGLVGRRAAQLSGVAVATVLVQTGRAVLPGETHQHLERSSEKIPVGVDGRYVPSTKFVKSLSIDDIKSLVEHYPGFEMALRESLRYLVGEEVEGRVDIGLAKDGSGVGGEISAC